MEKEQFKGTKHLHTGRLLIKNSNIMERLRKCRMSFWVFQAISMEILFLLNLMKFYHLLSHCCANLGWVVKSPLPFQGIQTVMNQFSWLMRAFRWSDWKSGHTCSSRKNMQSWEELGQNTLWGYVLPCAGTGPSLRRLNSAEAPSLGLKQLLFWVAVLSLQSKGTQWTW